MATTKIRIAARLRPRIKGEIDDDTVEVVRDRDQSSYIAVTHPRDPSQRFKFGFSSCYGQSSSQQEIFENDVQPLIDVVFGGVTVTVFAYGVTSSGKTHTMQGTRSDPGIIPRVVEALFQRKDHPPQRHVSLAVSYMEIYKEDVYDLLVDRDTAPKLPIRENDAGQVFVANLTSQPIASPYQFEQIYAAATKHRSTGSTNLNRASSRSHAILTIHVRMVDPNVGQTLIGKINLVDLAGSENNKLTGNDASRMAESAAINRSLSVLGQVVHALNQGASRIPYRDSKLTRLLQDALGGSAVGLLICNLAPGLKFRQDTWNTINFATRTKEIENKPVVNIRDNRPAPKAHFAALSLLAFKPPRASFPLLSNAVTGGPSRPTQAGPSKLPAPTKGRQSIFGFGTGGSGFQSFAMPLSSDVRPPESAAVNIGMTEKEIDDRISRAVEQEVARRLEERERERERERARERQAEEQKQNDAQPQQRQQTPEQPATLPSGVLTPLLKRHQDLDNELKRRLGDLEQKYDRGSKEIQLADVLSPVSKKKTGRAYVALARAHSEKGDLQVALDLYKKATSYVPDNAKLRERILDLEYAIGNGCEFISEPKKIRAKKTKTKKKGTKNKTSLWTDISQEQDSAEAINDCPVESAGGGDGMGSESRRGVLGEMTNGEITISPGKRHAENVDEDVETPPKKQKQGGRDSDDPDWACIAPQRKVKKATAI